MDGCKEYESIPNAYLLLSSLRSMGYSEETAIADIIDNCISAKATQIDLNFDWENKRIVVIDNGCGMKKEELLNAMKIGSSDPNTDRDVWDLGRFGMGMKTATFSIGKKLTVVTKDQGVISNACWDLDHIQKTEEWKILIENHDSIIVSEISSALVNNLSGTAVIIDNLDKLIDENSLQKSKEKFYSVVKKIKKHLGLVFHRFIEEDDLIIRVNGNEIVAWNPYILENPATQDLQPEMYYQEDKVISIEPYVLPHKTKFESEEKYNEAAGPKGWIQHQGFYVYRNRRLLVFGTWFGKFRKEPAYNLARIRLDITSHSDCDWNIDIKKSKATPPVYVDDFLEHIANLTIQKSMAVYNSRGTYSKNTTTNLTNLKFVWEQRKNSAGKYMFFLNKKHPLLMKITQELTGEQIKELKAYLSLVENFAPIMISGVAETFNSQKGKDVSHLERDTDILKLKNYIDTYKKIGFNNEEIYEAISTMPEYEYLGIEIEKLLLEV